mmetsp:Transcript_115094/g.311034  ORF Transcript_115094/g.311034 Transcript_115094/m.311034 type:complete len:92 (+) Transcript_115094:68-343(+)
MPIVRVTSFNEDVTAGYVAAYFVHLADASSQGYNMALANWVEQTWHLVFDRRFSLELDTDPLNRDLRALTRQGDIRLPLGVRFEKDSLMAR